MSYSDGRVLNLARHISRRGLGGVLLIEANLLPDQLPMAISNGLDLNVIVISEAHPLRCGELRW